MVVNGNFYWALANGRALKVVEAGARSSVPNQLCLEPSKIVELLKGHMNYLNSYNES